MEIPNYDTPLMKASKYKQLYPYLPDGTFGMMISGPLVCGKTNLLMHIFRKPLVHSTKTYLYAKNLEQDKCQELEERLNASSEKLDYEVIECSDGKEVLPLSSLDSGIDRAQRIVIFDDFVCEKNQAPLIEYFVGGRHKKCSVIYLSQSYFTTPNDIRNNCSHFCIYSVPNNQVAMICRDHGIQKSQFKRAVADKYSFLYLDKPRKLVRKNFSGVI